MAKVEPTMWCAGVVSLFLKLINYTYTVNYTCIDHEDWPSCKQISSPMKWVTTLKKNVGMSQQHDVISTSWMSVTLSLTRPGRSKPVFDPLEKPPVEGLEMMDVQLPLISMESMANHATRKPPRESRREKIDQASNHLNRLLLANLRSTLIDLRLAP